MVMKSTKKFVVVVYDIASTKRRSRIAELLQRYGVRVNLSVFECMLTDGQLESLKQTAAAVINPKKDKMIYYVLCLNCYTKICRQPENIEHPSAGVVSVV